ncbi:MAG: hypothetical protein AABY09_05590 [Nanoarchaeota archaeon]
MDKSDIQVILKKIDEKFEEADKRIDARFKESDKRIDARFKKVDERFQDADKKTDAKFLAFYHNLIEPNFKRIDAKLSEHDEKFKDVLGHFDAMWKRLETLEQEYHAIVNGLRRIEESLDTSAMKRVALEIEVKNLKEQVSKLQTKIETLEHRIAAPQ